MDQASKGEYLVQQVTLSPATSNIWSYRIDYGGRLRGLPDILKALVSAQQKKPMAETSIISKFDRRTETAGVSDTAATSARKPPWVCGDPDAICGFVMVAASPWVAGGLMHPDIWIFFAEWGYASFEEALMYEY